MSVADTLEAIVGAVLERSYGIHYLSLREYRVSSQNADGTLELESLEQRKNGKAPGLSNVRIMQIGPGSTIKPGPKSSVLVGFKFGKPDKRFALGLWEGSTANQMIIECLDLQLGGKTNDFAIKGTTFWNAYLTYLSAIQSAMATLQTALAAIVPPNPLAAIATPLGTFLTSWNTAITTFKAGSYLAERVKVK